MTFPDDVPTLADGDVTLRAHRLDDADACVEQCVDPVSVRWTTVPYGYDHAMAVDWLTNVVPSGWESGAERSFAIESTHPDGRRRFSGSVSLRDAQDRRAEIAFGAHPAVRGRGVMTAAVNLILDYGFDQLGLETVIWLSNVGNVGSRRVAWKTGFRFGGVLPRWLSHRGENLDAWVATLHKSDKREPASEWFDIPVIESNRLRLRPIAEADLPRLVEASSDERTQHWLAFMPSPYGENDARGFMVRSVTGAMEGVSLNWAVADRDTDVFLGTIGLPRSARSSWEIGYTMHPDSRGKHIMREALGLVVRHLFLPEVDGGLGGCRAFLKAADGNTASQYVATANGFTLYGRERQSELLGDGQRVDMLLFDLLRAEWPG